MIPIAESISPSERGIADMNAIKILGESTQINAGTGSSVPASVNSSIGAAVGAEYDGLYT